MNERSLEQEVLSLVDAIISGDLDETAFVYRLREMNNIEDTIEKKLRSAYQKQDWDAVDYLLLYVRQDPKEPYVPVLCTILDRECLEISNENIIDVLSVLKSPESVPALGRAMLRTSVDAADWTPGKNTDSINIKCVRVLGSIEGEQAIVWLKKGEAYGNDVVRNACQQELAMRKLSC